MLDETIRALRRLDGTHEFSVEIASDDDGYLDRECPDDACLQKFKVIEENWDAIGPRAGAHCPKCGHTSSRDRWHTTEQVEHAAKLAKQQAVFMFRSALRDGLKKDARAFNQRQRRGLVSISMNIRGSAPRRPPSGPTPVEQSLEQRIQCDECQCRFAVRGAYYFCPACGVSTADREAFLTLDRVHDLPRRLSALRSALLDIGTEDDADRQTQAVVESELKTAFSAFEAICKVLASRLPAAPKQNGNIFQRVEDGSTWWEDAIGQGYRAWLSGEEIAFLSRLVQDRHLLTHSNGIVDEKYLGRVPGTAARVGQRIHVRPEDAADAAGLLSKLTTGLRDAVARQE